MAYYSLVNVTEQTHAAIMLRFRDFMTSADPSGPGWSCVGSGDGKATGGTYSATDGSAIDNSVSGQTKSLNNANSWFVLKSPDSSRFFLFQRKSSTSDWKITYSRSAFVFTSANAFTAPALALNATNSVSDGSVIFDGTFFPHAEGQYWFDAVAGDRTNESSSFYAFAYPVGGLSGGATTMLALDVLSATSTADGDSDPCVVYANANASPTDASDGVLYNGRMHKAGNISGRNTFKGFVCWNQASPPQSFKNVTVSTYGSGTSASRSALNYAPYNMSTNAYVPSSDETLPVYYFVVTDPVQGSYDSFKGGSRLMLYGNPSRTTGQLLKLSSDGDKIFINGFLFPWVNATLSA